MCNATTCCSGKQKLCTGTRSVPKLSIHFQENSFLGWINLYMKVSGECVPWTWGNHYRSTPSQPQSKVFIEVWWGFQKDKSPRIFFHILLCIWRNHNWVGHTRIHTCPRIHSHGRGVSFGDVCTECTGCQPLHWAKCSAAEAALIVWAVCIQIQKYKMAIVNACNYYLVFGNFMWSWNNQ